MKMHRGFAIQQNSYNVEVFLEDVFWIDLADEAAAIDYIDEQLAEADHIIQQFDRENY